MKIITIKMKEEINDIFKIPISISLKNQYENYYINDFTLFKKIEKEDCFNSIRLIY